jgi:uncharacterized phage-like protein YoqJ
LFKLEDKKKKLGVTGHRELFHPDNIIKQGFKTYLETLAPDVVVTGMAIGFDQLCAEVCIELEIPFVAAIPYDGQEDLWSPDMKHRFYTILLQAADIVVVSPGEYQKWKLPVRNCWIVDRVDCLCSYLVEPRGGTLHCVSYAEKKNKPVFNLALHL